MVGQERHIIYKLIRQGYTFNRMLKNLRASQYYSKEELDELLNQKLRIMINHCYKNVPYYTDVFKQLKLTPDDIKTKENLKLLPFLEKQTVKKNYSSLIARNRSKILSSEAETSGTTGIPSRFLRDYNSINHENAVLWRFWQNAGDCGLKRVVLRGELVVPVNKKAPPFWKYYPSANELLMSSYHLTDENADIYLAEIERFDPGIIYAFPSLVFLLAKYFLNSDRRIRLKAVFTSSEILIDSQRHFIENIFQCPVYDWYGQVERVAAIGQCEKGTYHIIEDYSITEVVETEWGLEVVGTNLNNYIMPLIRFRTADIIELENKKCNCGRNFREVSRIQGRNLHYILSPEGKKMSLFLASSDSIRCSNNVEEVQFVQHKAGELIVNIVKNERFTERDREKIIKMVREHTSESMQVTVNEVDRIPRGPNGKIVNIVNNIPCY